MEKLNIPELYAETLTDMQAVLAGSQRMYEVYFFRQKHDGSTEKIVCQSLYCPDEDEQTYQILSERIELLASAHGLEPLEVFVIEMPKERVEQMFNRLHTELSEELQ